MTPAPGDCPRCGEDRLVDLVDSPRHPVMFCNVCGHSWRVHVVSVPVAKE